MTILLASQRPPAVFHNHARSAFIVVVAVLASGCLLRSPRADRSPSARATANHAVADGVNTARNASSSAPVAAVRTAEQSGDVVESRQRPTSNDRAVAGRLDSGWMPRPSTAMPRTPPENPRQGTYALADETTFAPQVEERLRRGATRVVELPAPASAMVMASVRWQGTASPLKVELSLDGSPLATGRFYALGSNRGGTSLSARTAAAGRARLSVTNTSQATVTVKITLGVLAP